MTCHYLLCVLALPQCSASCPAADVPVFPCAPGLLFVPPSPSLSPTLIYPRCHVSASFTASLLHSKAPCAPNFQAQRMVSLCVQGHVSYGFKPKSSASCLQVPRPPALALPHIQCLLVLHLHFFSISVFVCLLSYLFPVQCPKACVPNIPLPYVLCLSPNVAYALCPCWVLHPVVCLHYFILHVAFQCLCTLAHTQDSFLLSLGFL